MVDSLGEIESTSESGPRGSLDRLSDGLFSRLVNYYLRFGLLKAIADESSEAPRSFYREAQYYTTDPDLELCPEIRSVRDMVRSRMKDDENAVDGENTSEVKFGISLPSTSNEIPSGEDTKLGTAFDDGALKVIQRAYDGGVVPAYNSSSPYFAPDASPVFRYKWTFWRKPPLIKLGPKQIDRSLVLTVKMSQVIGFGLNNDIPITYAELERNPLGITTLKLLETKFPNHLDEPQFDNARSEWAVVTPLQGRQVHLATPLRSFSNEDLEKYLTSLVIHKASLNPHDRENTTFIPIFAAMALKSLSVALSFPTNMDLFK